MRALWLVLAILGVAALALTHLGRWVPLGDALAVIRPQVIVLSIPVILGLTLSWQARVGRAVAAVVLISVTLTGLDWLGGASRLGAEAVGSELTLYQKNLLWNGTDRAALLADIQAADPDLITLQEVSRQNALIVDGLKATHPYRLLCVSRGNGGIAILSRYPLITTGQSCSLGEGIVLARVDMPERDPIWVGSVHLNWPFPYDQARQVPGIIEGLLGLEGSVILGGDFNMVPWGSAVRRIGDAARSDRIGGYASTYPGFGMLAPLAIDHVLIPQGATGAIEIRPRLGSDHHGLLARFSL